MVLIKEFRLRLSCIAPLHLLSSTLLALLPAGCAAPIGAAKVTTRQAYAQVDANALRTGKPSADTVSLLHRFDLPGCSSSGKARRRRPARLTAAFARRAIFTTMDWAWRSRNDGAPMRPSDWKKADAACRWVKSNCNWIAPASRYHWSSSGKLLFQFSLDGVSRVSAGTSTPQGLAVFLYSWVLPAPVLLDGGTPYWLSIVNDTLLDVDDRWFWSRAGTGTNVITIRERLADDTA
jgi:hypothetical protein